MPNDLDVKIIVLLMLDKYIADTQAASKGGC